MKNCIALMECQWLSKLTSLRDLSLWGQDDLGLVSFPPCEISKEEETMLPQSLAYLEIGDFPNLKKLRKGIQFLTSLERLSIYNCSKLETLPVVLPLSLTRLRIYGSPLLEKSSNNRYQPNIAHIPHVDIASKGQYQPDIAHFPHMDIAFDLVASRLAYAQSC